MFLEFNQNRPNVVDPITHLEVWHLLGSVIERAFQHPGVRLAVVSVDELLQEGRGFGQQLVVGNNAQNDWFQQLCLLLEHLHDLVVVKQFPGSRPT